MRKSAIQQPTAAATRSRGRQCSEHIPAATPQGNNAELMAVLARRLKAVYIFERRQLERCRHGYDVPYEPSPRYDELDATGNNLWSRAAKHLYAQGYDPADYVLKIFGAIRGTAIAVLRPDEIVGQRAEAIYAKAQTSNRRDIEICYTSQCHKARTHLTIFSGKDGPTDSTVSRMLVDPLIQLSALFRYCFAVSMGNPKRFGRIAKVYKQAAIKQYMGNRDAYNAVWKGFIPASFRLEAERAYFAMMLDAPQPAAAIQVSPVRRHDILRPAFARRRNADRKPSSEKKKATRE